MPDPGLHLGSSLAQTPSSGSTLKRPQVSLYTMVGLMCFSISNIDLIKKIIYYT